MIIHELELNAEDGYATVLMQCDDEEAMRISRILRYPWTPNCKVCVYFSTEGLDTSDLHTQDDEGAACQTKLFEP